MPAQIDPTDLHLLLHGLDALRPSLGKSRLNKLLRGTDSREVQGGSKPLSGVFQGCTRAVVDRFLETLISQGLMHQGDEEDYFVCTITPKGRAAWSEKMPLAISLPRDPGKWLAADASGDDILTQLKLWRTAQATQEKLPPYCVFNDKTLMEIARVRPQSSEMLQSVPGIGPRKLEKYGDKVLKIIKA